MDGSSYRPNARRDGVLVEALDDELLVFDSERQCAHSLNACAARVWAACDGSRSVSELAEECQEDEETVLLALARLRDVNLLEQTDIQLRAPSSEPEGVSRRAMLRKSVVAGAGVGLAIPVIRSITAPSIAMASSGRGVNPKNTAGTAPVTNCPVTSCSPGSVCNLGPGGAIGHCYRPAGATCSPPANGHNGSACINAAHSSVNGCPANGVC